MNEFDYVRPETLEAALAILAADPDAKALAGGHTLVPVLKQRLAQPSKLVDLAALGLAGVYAEEASITIGAMTPHETTASDAAVIERIPGLARLASWIGDRQVRRRGTMGGALANNDPAACYPAAVLALGAVVHTDRRSIPADDYFQGLFATALEPDELIVAVQFPVPTRSNYVKFRNPASRYAVVGVFVAEGPAGRRVAVTGAGHDGVFRHLAAEQALAAGWSADAVAGVAIDPASLSGDIHASAAYRANLIQVLTARAVAEVA